MASEAKHTPGPWRFDHDWNRLPTVFGANGKKVCVIERDVRGEPTDEQRADAELIASLPTLLAERDAALVAVEEAKEESDRLRLLLSRAHYELDIAEQHFRRPSLPKDGLFGSRVNVLREDIRRELVGCPDPAAFVPPGCTGEGNRKRQHERTPDDDARRT